MIRKILTVLIFIVIVIGISYAVVQRIKFIEERRTNVIEVRINL